MLSPRLTRLLASLTCLWASLTLATRAIDAASVSQDRLVAPLDGAVVKTALDTANTGENLLKPDRFAPYERGYEREDKIFVCDNGGDATARRGVSQSVELNQKRPEPIVATAWSKAESATGTPDPDYSLYLDLVYADGTQLWGQSASFRTGTHDWQKRQVLVLPEKPVKRLSFYLLMRGHGGKASFRDPELRMVQAPAGAHVFDGVPVVLRGRPAAGFQVRDVAAGSDFVRIEKQALGLNLNVKTSESSGATFFDVTLADSTGKDRAITLVYAVPVPLAGVGTAVASDDGAAPRSAAALWMDDPRRNSPLVAGREYVHANRYPCGSSGRLSLYPLGAVQSTAGSGWALGIDMSRPAFFRIGYHAGTEELFLAYDIGLTPEKPKASLRFCSYSFGPRGDSRAALARYYELFADAFRCRTPEQGLWMPFAKISALRDWQDFGFKFKEGNDETARDDAHGIFTFRYTEPMTWWMAMPKSMPRTYEAAVAEARRLADKGNRQAQALFSSGYHNAEGRFPTRLLDTPWCNGAVWSMNSMPGIPGDSTDFRNKWSPALREQLYGPNRRGDLDGEYIDSSEGYVTDVLDFRRDHFAAADTPLCFSSDTHQPAIFRGLVAFEYVRAIADDCHGMNKLMMANGAPTQLCWLVPLIDVAGTETDWHHQGKWRPMSDAELLYRRALCKGKPYCFLMNTEFEKFGPELVEKYMKRSLAYGMFPGFFSHNASQGHYFTRPELYDRDRPLFKKYVPLSKLVAQAGWEPVTQAHSSDDRVYVERFGQQPRYLTVFNDSPERRATTITLDGPAPTASRELVRGGPVSWQDGKTHLTLDPEDVLVLELR